LGHRGKSQLRRSSGSERIFEDGARRLWSAGHTSTPRGSDAIVFTCLSDSREAVRAVVLEGELPLTEAGAEQLKSLLAVAPRLGRL